MTLNILSFQFPHGGGFPHGGAVPPPAAPYPAPGGASPIYNPVSSLSVDNEWMFSLQKLYIRIPVF